MFPEVAAHGSRSLPEAATFWMPRPDELDEEGFGFFQDTWLIKDVAVREAQALVAEERRIATVVDSLATDATDFERIAAVAEWGIDDDANEVLSDAEFQALAEVVSDVPPLAGLEIGVAGLVHALATVRILPAASCRSHPDKTWSETPVVLLAATEFRARALQPLAERAGCRFVLDVARPDLLGVVAPSVTNMMDLADAVLGHRDTFVQHRTVKKTQPFCRQDSLF